MKILLNKFTIVLILFFVAHMTNYSQQAKLSALSIRQSNIIEELKAVKTANPGIAVEELVKSANEILDKQGFNYAFALDENSCRQIAEVRKKQTDPNAPLNLKAQLSSVAGEKVSLILPPEKTDSSECGRCFIHLPVWEATNREFVTFIQNINVKLHLPGNFFLNEFALIDDKDLTTVIRRWKVPYRAAPLSVSDDGKILYLPLLEPELSDLALIVFDEGVIQFAARKDIDVDKKAKVLKEFPKDEQNPNLGFTTFENGELKQTIRYSTPCGASTP